MGVYLSKPIKDKASTDFENELLKCGASSMQGWRMSQEDAHNCCMDFDDGISLFAVYDGHGGHEVAEYAAEHLPGFIKKSEPYGKGDYQNALIDAFLEFDATLKTEPVIEELTKIAKNGKSTKDGEGEVDEEDEEDEGEAGVQTLREEASMPLAEVIAMYTSGNLPKTPKNKLLGSTSKVLSPFLRAKASGSSSSSNDNGVSSSSGSPPSSLINGVPEKSCDSSEQEASEPKAEQLDSAPSGSSSKGEAESSNGEVASSSISPDPQVSSTNEEGQIPTSSSPEKPENDNSGPSLVGDLTASLLEGSFASDEEDSSNDETFQANEDGASSSSDDARLNGSKESEDDEEGEEELEEESEEEDDEEEDYTDGEIIGMKAGPEEPAMDSGCTAVVALVTKDKIFVANAGDSRAILSRNGVAVDLSVDHKPEDPAELKRIQNAGGKVIRDGRVNGGLNLSRALGDHCYKKSTELDAREQMITALPDVVTENIDRSVDEFIVLACDGIWNSMSSQEVVDFVRPLYLKGETLSSICEKLFDACLAPDTMGDGTGCDNMTCVIVRLNSPDSPSTKRPLSAEAVDSPQDSKKVKLTEES